MVHFKDRKSTTSVQLKSSLKVLTAFGVYTEQKCLELSLLLRNLHITHHHHLQTVFLLAKLFCRFLLDMDTPGSPDMPDMLSIGRQCAVKSCRQLDFMPFTCDACHEVYCLEHRQYQSHACAKAGQKETTAIVCPLCARAIKLSPKEDPNVAFERHTAEVCQDLVYLACNYIWLSWLASHEVCLQACDPQNYAKVHRKARCPCPGCREKLTTINTYRCKHCALEVCLKHRFPSDHECPGRLPGMSDAPCIFTVG